MDSRFEGGHHRSMSEKQVYWKICIMRMNIIVSDIWGNLDTHLGSFFFLFWLSTGVCGLNMTCIGDNEQKIWQQFFWLHFSVKISFGKKSKVCHWCHEKIFVYSNSTNLWVVLCPCVNLAYMAFFPWIWSQIFQKEWRKSHCKKHLTRAFLEQLQLKVSGCWSLVPNESFRQSAEQRGPEHCPPLSSNHCSTLVKKSRKKKNNSSSEIQMKQENKSPAWCRQGMLATVKSQGERREAEKNSTKIDIEKKEWNYPFFQTRVIKQYAWKEADIIP